MDKLILDLLNFTRFSRAPVDLQSIDIEKLLHRIIEEHLAFQPPHATIDVQKGMPLVSGDVASLTQCLSNLLENAVKFVAPGVQPRVRAH